MDVPVTVYVGEDFKDTREYPQPDTSCECTFVELAPFPRVNLNVATMKVPLIQICYGRSGDKGDVANIGIIARKEEYYHWLCTILTANRVEKFFAHYCNGTTTRYTLPGIRALNFVLTKSLGGGGLSSLNIDRQGKSYAQNLLTMSIEVPVNWNLDRIYPSKI